MTPVIDVWAIVVFSLLGVLFANRLGLPSAIGVLVFGALIGPHGLNIVHENEVIEVFSEMGAIFLLFFIGLEFSIEKLVRRGLRALSLFIFKIGLTFLFAYIAALLLNFDVFNSILIGIIMSFSSTAIFARFLQDIGTKNKKEAQILTAVLIMEDIAAVFLLAIFAQLKNIGTISISAVIVPTLISLVIFSFSYIILRSIVKIFIERFVNENNTESLLFTALSLCALFASLGAFFGLPISIGAFLAGNIFSSTAILKKSKNLLTNFIIVFSSFFFFSIGMLIDLTAISTIWPLLIVFFVLAIVIKFFSMSLPSYLFGFDSKGAAFSGVMMLTISEFALIIAKEANPLTAFDIVTLSGSLLFLTALSSGVLYKKYEKIDYLINALLPKKIKERMHSFSLYLQNVFESFEPGGFFYNTASIEFKRISFNTILVIMINAILLLLLNFIDTIASILGLRAIIGHSIPLFFIGASIMLSAYPIFLIARSIKNIFVEFPRAFHMAHRNYISVSRRAYFDLFMFFLFFTFALFFPVFFTLISLPVFMQLAALIPLLISFAFALDLGSVLINYIRHRKE
ncbi:MAG: cation:proton antiporter [Candidatus Bilamarchaeaceae archaeon]